MELVATLDQRDSRNREDLVGPWLPRLNERLGPRLVRPFVRTAGDEMQAVASAGAVGELAQEVFRSGEWWLGIGVGPVEEPLPAEAAEGRGPAFWAAREAVESAKKGRGSRPFAVRSQGEDPEQIPVGLWLEECLGGLAFVITRRTRKQRLAAEAFDAADGDVAEVARALGVSVQGARQRVVAAGCEEERELALLAARIVGTVLGPR